MYQLIAIAAAGVVVVLAGWLTKANWRRIERSLKGNKVAVLGARGVGKTCLLNFLTTGSLPAEYRQTPSYGGEKVPGRKFNLKDLELKVGETRDLAGDTADYGDWKALHDEADVVFYLLRADRIMAGDAEVEERVRSDLRHVGGWLEERKTRPRFFVVGTHCDMDPEYLQLSRDMRAGYVDRFRKLPVVAELVARAGGTQSARMVLGSMESVVEAEELLYNIFHQILP